MRFLVVVGILSRACRVWQIFGVVFWHLLGREQRGVILWVLVHVGGIDDVPLPLPKPAMGKEEVARCLY